MKSLLSVSRPRLPRLFSWQRAKQPIEKEDIELLEIYKKRMNALSLVPYQKSCPLYSIAVETKRALVDDSSPSFSLTASLSKADKLITSSKEALSEQESHDHPTLLRLTFAQFYFQRLRKSIDAGEITQDSVAADYLRFKRLLDAVLLGTASERIETHMRFFGSPLNQERMKECFYSLYEPEIDVYVTHLLAERSLHKHHRKNLVKYSKTYLLDKAELSTKIRCVLAWSDPNYSGFQALENDFAMPLEVVLKARKEFYPEGEVVGEQFATDYLGTRRAFYAAKQEDRQMMRRGILYIIATCLLDWAICVM